MRKRTYDHFPKSGLVKQYEPFIKKWCANFGGQYTHLEMADILSDAVAIAFEAERKFKPELGNDFSTYLRHCLLGMHRSAQKATGEQKSRVMRDADYAREMALDNPPMPALRLPGGKRPRLIFDLSWATLRRWYGPFIKFFDHPNWSSDRSQDIPEFKKLCGRAAFSGRFLVQSYAESPPSVDQRHRVVAGIKPGGNAAATYKRIAAELRALLPLLRPTPVVAGWLRAVFDHHERRQREADWEATRPYHDRVLLDAEPNARVKFAQPKRPFRILQRYLGFVSVQMRVGKSQHEDGSRSNGLTLGDVLPDSSATPEENLITAEQRDILDEAKTAIRPSLTENEARVLDNLDTHRSHGWKADLAREIGVTDSAVSKMEDRVTERIVRWVRDRKLA
jgi:RNA polymerase sigma factor (sigma-70 family)